MGETPLPPLSETTARTKYISGCDRNRSWEEVGSYRQTGKLTWNEKGLLILQGKGRSGGDSLLGAWFGVGRREKSLHTEPQREDGKNWATTSGLQCLGKGRALDRAAQRPTQTACSPWVKFPCFYLGLKGFVRMQSIGCA